MCSNSSPNDLSEFRCCLDSDHCARLSAILSSFQAAISEEQAWALCYQAVRCFQKAWNKDTTANWNKAALTVGGRQNNANSNTNLVATHAIGGGGKKKVTDGRGCQPTAYSVKDNLNGVSVIDPTANGPSRVDRQPKGANDGADENVDVDDDDLDVPDLLCLSSVDDLLIHRDGYVHSRSIVAKEIENKKHDCSTKTAAAANKTGRVLARSQFEVGIVFRFLFSSSYSVLLHFLFSSLCSSLVVLLLLQLLTHFFAFVCSVRCPSRAVTDFGVEMAIN